MCFNYLITVDSSIVPLIYSNFLLAISIHTLKWHGPLTAFLRSLIHFISLVILLNHYLLCIYFNFHVKTKSAKQRIVWGSSVVYEDEQRGVCSYTTLLIFIHHAATLFGQFPLVEFLYERAVISKTNLPIIGSIEPLFPPDYYLSYSSPTFQIDLMINWIT